jgi:hypothetical protein
LAAEKCETFTGRNINKPLIICAAGAKSPFAAAFLTLTKD